MPDSQTTDPAPAIGELIRVHRKRHRYGVRGMAKIIGISTATLSRIECGKSMDGTTMLKVITWLFGGSHA